MDKNNQLLKNNPAIGRKWSDIEKELFTPEEIAESNARVEIMLELIKARQEKGICQKQLEEMTGVRQPVISRMEQGKTSPRLDTVLKILSALGKTLKVVPISSEKS